MMADISDLSVPIRAGSEPGILQTVRRGDVRVALWARPIPGPLAAALDALPVQNLPRLRRNLNVSQVAAEVQECCVAAGAQDCAASLSAEISKLAAMAAGVFGTPDLRLRLDVSEGQSCPKWHVDAVIARLLCTFRGAGTQFGPAGPDGHPQTVHQMARGAVGIFRGSRGVASDATPVLHRSPPKRPGEPRLLLVIDPAEDEDRF